MTEIVGLNNWLMILGKERRRTMYKSNQNDQYLLFKVGDWMTPYPYVVHIGETFRKAAELVITHDLDSLPIVDEAGYPLGILTAKKIMTMLLENKENLPIEQNFGTRHFYTVTTDESLIDLVLIPHQMYLVVDNQSKLLGVVTKQDVLEGFAKYIYKLEQRENSLDVLKVILEKAYEGIAVVDRNGILMEFNEAYSQFTGVKREDAIGNHVTEVIDNTNLHITVKTGIPDRGVLQVIQGQSMVVHRIPIWKDGKITGAIGMLIFEGVSEIYEMYNRFQTKQLATRQETQKLSIQAQENNRATMNQIIGTSKEILSAKRMARRAARTVATVFISGESGTGKEVFAKSIHHLSPRSTGPFISVNCGAIPEGLFESELFGYEAGAFTGALQNGKPGKIELAHNGTLFLDEIGELSMPLQTKLLRVLQEREVERVGGIKKYDVNVRIIAATNRDVEKMVEEGSFREDLYYRLNIIRLHLPSLRKRREDIPSLLAHFLKEVCQKYQLPNKLFSTDVVAYLMNYQWNGNIRELINTVEYAVVMTENDVIEIEDLPSILKEETPKEVRQSEATILEQLYLQEEQTEKNIISQALQAANGNKSKAAETLGIHRSTLYRKLKKYEI